MNTLSQHNPQAASLVATSVNSLLILYNYENEKSSQDPIHTKLLTKCALSVSGFWLKQQQQQNAVLRVSGENHFNYKLE